MAEIWDKAAEQYKMVEKLLDPESDICSCVTDIESNDVLNYLNLLAFKIKYPGITSGNKTITDHCKFNTEVTNSHVMKLRANGIILKCSFQVLFQRSESVYRRSYQFYCRVFTKIN